MPLTTSSQRRQPSSFPCWETWDKKLVWSQQDRLVRGGQFLPHSSHIHPNSLCAVCLSHYERMLLAYFICCPFSSKVANQHLLCFWLFNQSFHHRINQSGQTWSFMDPPPCFFFVCLFAFPVLFFVFRDELTFYCLSGPVPISIFFFR